MWAYPFLCSLWLPPINIGDFFLFLGVGDRERGKEGESEEGGERER